MRVAFGRYKGSFIWKLVFENPDYIRWANSEMGPDHALRRWAHTYIEAIDQLPLQRRCRACGLPATRISVPEGSTTAHGWCDGHDPGDLGRGDRTFTRYDEALSFGYRRRSRRRSTKPANTATRRLVRALLDAKGRPKRLTAKAASEWLGLSPNLFR